MKKKQCTKWEIGIILWLFIFGFFPSQALANHVAGSPTISSLTYSPTQVVALQPVTISWASNASSCRVFVFQSFQNPANRNFYDQPGTGSVTVSSMSDSFQITLTCIPVGMDGPAIGFNPLREEKSVFVSSVDRTNYPHIDVFTLDTAPFSFSSSSKSQISVTSSESFKFKWSAAGGATFCDATSRNHGDVPNLPTSGQSVEITYDTSDSIELTCSDGNGNVSRKAVVYITVNGVCAPGLVCDGGGGSSSSSSSGGSSSSSSSGGGDCDDSCAATTCSNVWCMNSCGNSIRGTMVCGGGGGSSSSSSSSGGTPARPTISSFSASKTSLDAPESVTLSWRTVGSARCTASGGWSGNITPVANGTSRQDVNTTTSYSLQCFNASGVASSVKSVTVTVKNTVCVPNNACADEKCTFDTCFNNCGDEIQGKKACDNLDVDTTCANPSATCQSGVFCANGAQKVSACNNGLGSCCLIGRNDGGGPPGGGGGTTVASSSSLVPCGRNTDDSNTREIETDPCTICHIIVGGNRLMTWGRNIMSIIAITVIVAMGILYIVSAGNEGMMKTAKSGMLAALVGFAIMLSAWLIVNVVMNVLVDKGSPDKPFLGLMQEGRFYFFCDTTSNGNR